MWLLNKKLFCSGVSINATLLHINHKNYSSKQLSRTIIILLIIYLLPLVSSLNTPSGLKLLCEGSRQRVWLSLCKCSSWILGVMQLSSSSLMHRQMHLSTLTREVELPVCHQESEWHFCLSNASPSFVFSSQKPVLLYIRNRKCIYCRWFIYGPVMSP